MSEMWIVKNEEQANLFCAFVKTQLKADREMIYELRKGTRTAKQNRAMHLCMRRLAEELNNAGWGIPHPLNPKLEIPYTPESVKELMVRPVILAMYGKESTAELSTTELTQAFDGLLNRIAEATGVAVDFPTHELR